tara:strand:- start:105 stop:743 length:639 start_codon:yes stop_codon:yes gene_type:complete
MKIALAGKIACGKSTLAASIAEKIGGRRIGFADKVREVIEDLYGPGHHKDRRLLTGVGMGLRTVDPDTWLNVVLNRTTQSRENWVLDDLRFPNELHALKKNEWTIFRIDIGDALQESRIKSCYGDKATEHATYTRHISETSLDDTPDDTFDYIISVRNNTDTNMEVYITSTHKSVPQMSSPLTTIDSLATHIVSLSAGKIVTQSTQRMHSSA